MNGDDDEPPPADEDAIARMIEQSPSLDAAEASEIPQAQWDGDIDVWCAWRGLDDLGNAKRLRARYGDDLAFVRGIGWYAWDGRCWNRDDGEERAHVLAQKTAEAIREEVKRLGKEHEKRARALAVHAGKSSSSWSVAAMRKEAQPHLLRPLAEFDARPLLLNVANGTLELSPSPRRRPPRRQDLISRRAPAVYDPDADFPLFREFLATIQPDPEVREFLQRFFGYAITGSTAEQVMLICHGTGANGKSTLLDAVRTVVGNYAVVLPFASLLADNRRGGGDATPDIARLPGARLVTASEPELGRAFSEATIKTLTGENTITARHLREGFFEFTPQFKMVVSCNNRPTVRGQDDGIWRRLLLLPFDVVIPKAERRLDLGEQLQVEASGILNWLVQGAALYLTDGLKVPEQVSAVTRSYREESNHLGRFLEEWTLRGVDAGGQSTQAKVAHAAYRLWCRREGIDQPYSQTRFGLRLGDRGIRKERIGVWFYQHFVLTDEAKTALAADGHAED